MQSKPNIAQVKNKVFLKDIFFLTITAFGGPETHLAMFLERLVKRRKYISEEELLELNSLCTILPGPSTTQTLTAVGFKIGGPKLAFLTLLIWILPATILMTLLALSANFLNFSYFRFLQPLAVGFVVVAFFKMIPILKAEMLYVFLSVLACVVAILFRSPWIFPILILIGAFFSANFGNHIFIPNNKPIINVRWANFTLFVAILVGAALIGAFTRATLPQVSEPARLFENTYRMGSLVFGGGNVLYPMIITEFVEFKSKQYISMDEFNTGLGMLQGIPGPRFTIATYVNGLAMKKLGYDNWGQLIGCLIGTIAIFLPGTLLIFFVYPIWGQLKTYPIIKRSLDGVIAAAIGLVAAASILMFLPLLETGYSFMVVAVGIVIITVVSQIYFRIPSYILVLCTLLAGFIF